MNIVWQYLDKRAATVNALKDYNSMKHIINHTDEDITVINEKMASPASPIMSGMPLAHNPHAGEKGIIASIDEIDVLRERSRQALEYMSWFEPAWEELSDDERYVLTAFYLKENQRQMVYTVCEHFKIEKSSAYNKKNRALQRLTLLLYGK